MLVAIMNSHADFELARSQAWYRIPVSAAGKWLKGRWPPKWIAFYQTRAFGKEAYSVNYYAQVLGTETVARAQLFPDEPQNEKSNRLYYKLALGPMLLLPTQVVSPRWRRIVFIATTWEKFRLAREINDLYDESPLEESLWAELKQLEIQAERQEHVRVNKRDYFLDFAVYCRKGKLDVEADGDTWHSDPRRIPLDNLRDNDIQTAGWSLLRFNGMHIKEKMTDYCLPTIADNVNRLGGVNDERIIPRQISIDGDLPDQLGLFDDM